MQLISLPDVREVNWQDCEPTLFILGVNKPSALVKTSSTTSAAVMEAYFLRRSMLPMDKKELEPCRGSKTLFLIFLRRSLVSSSSSLWMSSLPCSRTVCSLRLTFARVWEDDIRNLYRCCSIPGKSMSWCHLKARHLGKWALEDWCYKTNAFCFFLELQQQHIFEDPRKQNFQQLTHKADAAFAAVWAGQSTACSTGCLLPILEGRWCESWFRVRRETHSCSGRPDTAWTQAGPLEV